MGRVNWGLVFDRHLPWLSGAPSVTTDSRALDGPARSPTYRCANPRTHRCRWLSNAGEKGRHGCSSARPVVGRLPSRMNVLGALTAHEIVLEMDRCWALRNSSADRPGSRPPHRCRRSEVRGLPILRSGYGRAGKGTTCTHEFVACAEGISQVGGPQVMPCAPTWQASCTFPAGPRGRGSESDAARHHATRFEAPTFE